MRATDSRDARRPFATSTSTPGVGGQCRCGSGPRRRGDARARRRIRRRGRGVWSSHSNSPCFSSARVTRGGDGVDQALEFGFALMRPPPLIARRPTVIAVVHLRPITGHVLTAPTGAPRARRAPHLPSAPGPPPCCRGRFAADSKSHQIDRRTSALEPTTNLTTTTPILPEQRRSAGCFSYPSAPSSGKMSAVL